MKSRHASKLREWQVTCRDGQQACSKCGSDKFLTVDHIVPASLLMEFLAMEECEELESNFQILCRYCNVMKKNRLDVRNPKTYEVLQAVMDKARKNYLQA